MGRVGRLLLPYGIVVAEYLLAGALLYAAAKALTPPPPPHTCIDSCWGGAALVFLFSISGGAVLSVGLLVAVALVAARQRRAGRPGQLTKPRRSAAGIATLAAAQGVLWGVVALPALWCIAIGGPKLL